MEFVIEISDLLVMKKSIIVKNVNMGLPDCKVIKTLQKDQSCEYLGILEVNRTLAEEMKMIMSK